MFKKITVFALIYINLSNAGDPKTANPSASNIDHLSTCLAGCTIAPKPKTSGATTTSTWGAYLAGTGLKK